MRIKSWTMLPLLFVAVSAGTAAAGEDGWVSLFNGKDLSGWKLKHEGGPNGWTVQDGVYINTPPSSDIVTRRELTDFHLHVELMIPKGSNSGVYLRGRHEVQIFDSFGRTEVRPSDCGAVYGVAPPATNASRAPGEWQTFDITLVGQRLIVFHNGVCIHNNRNLGAPAAPGPVLLQGDHGKVSFRNLRIQPLGPGYAAKAKVYVLNSTVDEATVVSVPEHEIIGEIKVGANPHGIEADAAQTRLFISAEGDGFVNVIDPVTDKVLKRIPVGPAPNEVAATPDGRLLYVPSGSTGDYEAVDVEQGKIVAKVKTGGSPHNVVCSADGRHMFLSPVGNPNKIFVVETATHQIVNTIPLGKEARPIAVRRDKQRLYIQHNELCGFELADVSDVNRCKIVQTVYIQLTPEQQAVPRQAVPCHGIALTPDEKELWVCDANHDLTAVFDVSTEPPKQLAQVPAKRQPVWLTFSPDGKYSYITNRGTNEVQVVEVATRETVKWINMGEPERILAGKPGMHVGGAGKGPARILAVTVPQF